MDLQHILFVFVQESLVPGASRLRCFHGVGVGGGDQHGNIAGMRKRKLLCSAGSCVQLSKNLLKSQVITVRVCIMAEEIEGGAHCK